MTHLPKAETLGSVSDSSLRARLICAETALLLGISIKQVLNCILKHLLNKVQQNGNTNGTLQIPLHLYCGVTCLDRKFMFKRVHYGAASRKVEGSIPDVVIGIFQGLISSGLTVAVGSNRNEYYKCLLGRWRWGVKAAGT
jgi:hypothetical protein